MSYLFGPVPSRRLGQSLGIDLVPFKTCSLDCIYCECGKTTRLTAEQTPLIDTSAVLEEVTVWLKEHPAPDYITFGGSGEPTLCSGFGALAAEIKQRWPSIKLAILTNATLTGDPAVRRELTEFDLILPSLDAAFEESFQQINRPAPGITLQQVVDGLTSLRREYNGTIWLELFIVPGINDSAAEIDAFLPLLNRIQPDQIQLNTLDRPGTESDLIPASKKQLEEIQKKFGANRTVIIARGAVARGREISGKEAEKRIVLTAARRPLTKADITALTGLNEKKIEKLLQQMIGRNVLVKEQQEGDSFFRAVNRN